MVEQEILCNISWIYTHVTEGPGAQWADFTKAEPHETGWFAGMWAEKVYEGVRGYES